MNPIIISGMHRSGTSMITRLLSRMGLAVGALRDSNDESWLFLAINRFLVRKCGGRWDYPRPVVQLLEHSEKRQAYVDRMRQLIQRPYSLLFSGAAGMLPGKSLERRSEPWGWKDPRNCLTLPLWLEVFPNARVIHISRHGLDVAESPRRREVAAQARAMNDLQQRPWYFKLRLWHGTYFSPMAVEEIQAGLDLWADYNRFSELATAHLPAERVLRLRYEDFLSEPESGLSKLASFCELQAPSPGTLRELTERLDASRCFAYRKSEALRSLESANEKLLRSLGY